MESFEEMFEQSLKSIKPQTVIQGEIIAISNGEIFVNIGYKADGIIARNEFSYDESKRPEDTYSIGDIIDVYVVRLNDGRGNVELSLKKLEGKKLKEEFNQQVEQDETITGKVSQILDNGIRVNYNGLVIFIPGNHLVKKDLQEYAGKNVSCKIITNERNRIIGSERIAYRQQKSELAKETLEKINVGDKVKGTVKRINEYGAFVDIGGVEGLLHISQMTWKRNANPKDFVKEGQEIEVEILKFDKEDNKIALKSKNEEDNPWNKVGTAIKQGDKVEVKVERILPFGVFVEIIEGLEGFIHISQISNQRIGNPSEVLSVGQKVEAKVVEIDAENKKIELTIKGIEENQATLQQEETVANN